MKLIIRPEEGFGKIKVELDEGLEREILRLARRYGFSPEKVIEIALTGEFRGPKGDVDGLEERARELEKRVWELEMEYAPLRYRAYGVSEDNKILAIELSGLIAENNQLRRFLGLHPNRDPELRKLISYYMK
ncbi:hypothetical protein [Thermococcus waiotapuensis]|uniref:Uncharacterized protein n=1 Tax=Thermococcus waiotapuensis TaxID=90909 RepID=A0AAE4NVE2_9EURY|nr:hypothetical protein [Thermococcus waiotapuensis]MDV3103350.1 hypothetical protein [Thermococcus waiotapuensis]